MYTKEEAMIIYNCTQILDNFKDRVKSNFYEDRQKINERKKYIIDHIKRTLIRFPKIETELQKMISELTLI
jgi:hypothetical protein